DRLKEANQRLGSALENEQRGHRETEAAARLKEELEMTVSHELRTPLPSISGWALILETGRLQPDQTKSAIESIARSARVQARLIDDLLDASRVVSGQLRLDVGPVRVADVVHEAIVTVTPAADAKTLRLEDESDTSVGTITRECHRA